MKPFHLLNIKGKEKRFLRKIEKKKKILTASVPFPCMLSFQLPFEALLDVREGVILRGQDLPEQSYVGDGQPKRVDLGQALLERKRGHVTAQLVEGRVDAEHAFPFADVRRVSLYLIGGAWESIEVTLIATFVARMHSCEV